MVLHGWFQMTHVEYCFASLAVVAAAQIAFAKCVKNDSLAGGTLMGVAALSYLVKLHVSPVAMLNSIFLFSWGLRIVVRGIPAVRDKEFLFGERPAFEIAVNRSVWIWLLCAPTVYYTTMDLPDKESPTWVAAGTTACAVALLYDFIEDPRKGVFCRNPYAFSSATINWGLFMMRPSLATLPFATVFFAIVYVAPGGACWAEKAVRDRQTDETSSDYRENTSAYVPIPTIAIDNAPNFVKQILVY